MPLNARSEFAKLSMFANRGSGGASGGRLRQVRIALRRRRRAARLLRIEETFRLEQRGDPFHVSRRFAGVFQPGLEPDARIGRGR